MKHAHAAGEQSVLGQLAPNNTIPRLTKRNFLRKVAPKTERSKSQRRCVMCVRAEKKNLQGTAVKYVMWAFVQKIAVSCTTLNSISKVMNIIILHLRGFKTLPLKFQKNSIISSPLPLSFSTMGAFSSLGNLKVLNPWTMYEFK